MGYSLLELRVPRRQRNPIRYDHCVFNTAKSDVKGLVSIGAVKGSNIIFSDP